MILAEVTLMLIGCIALSLAMKRHFLQVQPQPLQHHLITSTQLVWVLRTVGIFCLLLSGYLCLLDQGTAVGLVFFIALITLTALLQSLLLTYRPQWVIPIGLSALVLAAVSGIIN